MNETTRMNENQERTWAIFCHLGGLAGFTIPLGNILVPLVIWLIKRHESAFVDDQGKESLNFQISVTIYCIVAGLLTLILVGFVLLGVLAIFAIVMIIIAAMKANSGERYRYPLTIRLIS